MSSVANASHFQQALGPTCLDQYLENPNRLVTLWTMLQIAAESFVELGRIFEEWMRGPAVIAGPQQQLDDNTYASFEQGC